MTEKKPKAAPAKPKPILRKAGTKAKQGLEQGINQARRTSRDVIAATRVKGEAVIADARVKGEAAIKTARKRGGAVIADALAPASFAEFLRLALPGGLMMQIEGNSFDITNVLASLLGA